MKYPLEFHPWEARACPSMPIDSSQFVVREDTRTFDACEVGFYLGRGSVGLDDYRSEYQRLIDLFDSAA